VETIKLFVGLDSREPVAFHTFVHSVLARTKAQVSVTPVTGEQRDASNSFVYQRFLVPWMCNYSGWAIFADGDMTCRADIAELWSLRDPHFDVMVVKHEYATKYSTKYLGQPNENYPAKNWSSVMLINCGNYPWRKITPEYVAKASGAHLHRFEFLKQDRIGELPKEWNWLSIEYEFSHEAKLIHHTLGTPCWKPYSYLDPYSVDWKTEHQAMNYFEPWNSDDSVRVSER
jgi:lipopolysaccharide biosynthesis glycosyltransferase